MPSISLELPELRLPSLARYRRGPYMTTDSARAPWVEGRALEFNPVGPDRDRDLNDRSALPPAVRPRELPSCVAPAARSCDAPETAPAADARYREDSGDLNAQDQQLQLLREQAVSLQKAIDSLSNNRKATAELTERERLRRKEQEVDELRSELQRMRAMVSDNQTQSGKQTQSSKEVTTSVANRNQTVTAIRQVSAEAALTNRVPAQPCSPNGNCNGQQCKPPTAQTQTNNNPTFERPIVTKRETASRFKPSSVFGR